MEKSDEVPKEILWNPKFVSDFIFRMLMEEKKMINEKCWLKGNKNGK
ncbi:hypothetical protein LCGC14_2216340 [marine sediment metagenome]|uniref:Uncharacterized protein n=1 Tax=marine sediment metagenome TaxID=412755 RepID=A0A0F9G7Y1_9ZZZZ